MVYIGLTDERKASIIVLVYVQVINVKLDLSCAILKIYEITMVSMCKICSFLNRMDPIKYGIYQPVAIYV